MALNQFDSGQMNGSSIANDDLLRLGHGPDRVVGHQPGGRARGFAPGRHRCRHQSSAVSHQRHEQPDAKPSAAEDGVRSADITQEVANLTKYQILSQTGISALAQANQMQQSVLKLLQ